MKDFWNMQLYEKYSTVAKQHKIRHFFELIGLGLFWANAAYKSLSFCSCYDWYQKGRLEASLKQSHANPLILSKVNGDTGSLLSLQADVAPLCKLRHTFKSSIQKTNTLFLKSELQHN